MMFAHLRDPDLPALETLDQAALDRICGARRARLLRARYQPGARAILHVALGDHPGADEGSVWFYAGTKAQSLVRRLPDARLDAASGGLFQSFPHDHRMPHLAVFVAGAMGLAPRLIGGAAAGPPRLMRYRPGLSATFRWQRADGRVFFVKQTPGEDVVAQAAAVTALGDAARGLAVGFAPVMGVIPDLGLIAYARAEGQGLDQMLPDAPQAMGQVTQALRALWCLPVAPVRVLDRDALLTRADQARQMIALLDPETGQTAAGVVACLAARPVTVRRHPIHADMKLEHAFLSGPHTTLIDTESLSLGDPDYDLAKLEARVGMALLAGQITPATARTATARVRHDAGPDYPWFLTCARLQCAKFFAQRFDPATIPLMRQILNAADS